MELKHLRFVIALAEELHFGRAAARLYISQPPLSQHIKRLENELGTKLFVRTKRKVQLTEAGEILVEQGRRILTDVDRAIQSVANVGHGESGSLRIGSLNSARHTLPDAIRVFARKYPHVRIDLLGIPASERIEALRAGRIDIGFLDLPMEDPYLAVKPLFSDPLVAAFPHHHRLAARKTVPIAALSSERFLLISRRAKPAIHNAIISMCQKAGFSPQIAQEVDDLQSMATMVAAGVGVSIVAASVQPFQRDEIALRTLQPSGPLIGVGAAYRRDNPSNVLCLFLQILDRLAARKPAGTSKTVSSKMSR
jgi:DNA-binding transcriptional LysR family regulator